MSSNNISRNQLFLGVGVGAVAAGAATAVSIAVVPLLPIAVFGAGVVGLVAGSFIPDGSKRREKKKIEEYIAPLDLFEDLPIQLKEQVRVLQENAKTHRKEGTSLVEEINNVVVNTQELFKRITQKMDTQVGRMTAVNYTVTLTKLNKALSPEYYIDIKKNGHLWENPTARLAAVKKALEATSAQLITNIKQINASQDIEFTIAIDSLINAADVELDISSGE